MDADTTSALDDEHAQRLMVPTEIRIGRNRRSWSVSSRTLVHWSHRFTACSMPVTPSGMSTSPASSRNFSRISDS
jgi:hypothetical protein